jgi:hypothetical protein
VTCFPGWTFEYIDECMTLPRVHAITRYQKQNPPVHWMLASFFGAGDKKQDEGEPSDLMSADTRAR